MDATNPEALPSMPPSQEASESITPQSPTQPTEAEDHRSFLARLFNRKPKQTPLEIQTDRNAQKEGVSDEAAIVSAAPSENAPITPTAESGQTMPASQTSSGSEELSAIGTAPAERPAAEAAVQPGFSGDVDQMITNLQAKEKADDASAEGAKQAQTDQTEPGSQQTLKTVQAEDTTAAMDAMTQKLAQVPAEPAAQVVDSEEQQADTAGSENEAPVEIGSAQQDQTPMATRPANVTDFRSPLPTSDSTVEPGMTPTNTPPVENVSSAGLGSSSQAQKAA